MLRYLKIAVSVICLMACVLLIVLWVRSYTWEDSTCFLPGHIIASLQGKLIVDGGANYTYVNDEVFVSRHLTFDISSISTDGIVATPTGSGISIPYWFPVVLTTALSAAPWIRWSWRFSLRTLLITMTLIAMVLGLIVAFAR